MKAALFISSVIWRMRKEGRESKIKESSREQLEHLGKVRKETLGCPVFFPNIYRELKKKKEFSLGVRNSLPP